MSEDTMDIMKVAIVSLTLNLMITFAFAFASQGLTILSDNTQVELALRSAVSDADAVRIQNAIDTGLCTPAQVDSGECSEEIIKGTEDPSWYDTIAGIANLGLYFFKFVKFVTMSLFIEFILIHALWTKHFVINFFLSIGLGFWNIIVLYNLIRFLFKGRQ